MMRAAFASLMILLVAACAQVRDISGGEKDVTGPVLLEAVPPNQSTGFNASRILLRFNERVQLERVRERLLISPPLEKPPTLRLLRGTDVEIELNAPLRANTTYTFSMGEVVKDLTEGNYASGMDYVVSTGEVLDSLAIIGSVTHAFKGDQQKDMLVLLFAADDTSDFVSSRPLYATRTDANGLFRLQHLRAGEYTVRALRDQNANYRYDLPNEEIAFAAAAVAAVVLDSTMEPLHLRSFQEVSAVQTVREASVEENGALRVVLAKPAYQLNVRDIERSGGKLRWSPEWSTGRDSVLLWPSDTTALGEGRYELSTEAGILDTLRYRAVRKMPFHTNLLPASTETEAGLIVRVRAARPISTVDTSLIRMMKDSIPVAFTVVRDTAAGRWFSLRPAMEAGSTASLLILPKAVRDIYNGYNDTLRTTVGRAAEQRTGTLRVSVERTVPAGSMLLQLLDGQGRVVRETTLQGSAPVVWERIEPGNHTLRLIDDDNGNGRWDTGVWTTRLQPELVWYQGEVINVRAAWDLGIEWKMDQP